MQTLGRMRQDMVVVSKKKKIAPKILAKKADSKPKKTTTKPSRHRNISILKLSRPSLMSQLTSRTGEGQKLSPRLQAAIDKSEIYDVLTTFARGIDRVDENLLRGVLHPEVTFDLGPGVFQGTGNDYIQWVMAVLHGIKTSHHMIGNVRVDLEGDVALVESYFRAHFRVEKPTGREDVSLGGRNLDRMERRPSGSSGVWKLMHRKQVLDWVRTEAASDIFYHQNPDALWSYRTKIDPSYQMAQFPGSQSHSKMPAFLGRRYESKSVKL
jgi:hypothetical protein